MKLNTITKVVFVAVLAAGMYSCQNGDEFISSVIKVIIFSMLNMN